MKQKQHLSFCWFLATISVSICSSLLFFSCNAKKLCNSPPSSCGSLNIRYPFRLKTDPLDCGYRDCELSCEANQPFIYFESVRRYYVESISYENQTIRLIDLELANSTCSPLSGKILSSYSPFTAPSYRFATRVSFLNCSRSIEKGKRYGSIPSCLNSSQFLDYHFYVGVEITLKDLNDLPCSIVAEAPVLLDGERGDDLWNDANFSEIHSRLRMGFDLLWYQVVERDCDFYHRNYSYSTHGFDTVSCISYPRRRRSFLRVVAEKLRGYVINWSDIRNFIDMYDGDADGMDVGCGCMKHNMEHDDVMKIMMQLMD